MRIVPVIVALVTVLAPVSPAGGGEAAVSGSIELQSRIFLDDPVWAGQEAGALSGSAVSTTEIRWRNAAGDQRASLIPVLRWDASDDERSLADLREAYWALEAGDFELLIGANTVFWGVTESVHLVDVINQTDFAADIDGEDKLGQPIVKHALQRDWGLVSVYVMPVFRERTFPGVRGRLRTPLPVDTDRPVYESSAGDDHVDVALRYSHYIGDVDIGLSLFSGTSREPILAPSPDGRSLVPVYGQVGQFGIDFQYTRDAWLWKLEAVARDGVESSYVAAVGGFEYTFYQVRDSAADIGVLFEYQYDGRGDGEPVTISDDDIFLGMRFALNDINDTAVLGGLAYDTATGETFISMEAERRLGDAWSLELRARAVTGAAAGDTTFAFAGDDYVQVSIARYF